MGRGVSADDFRRIVLAMEGAVESAHMAHPDFRLNGKIFATIAPAGDRGMVKLTPELQREYLREHPAMFEPASGAWGRQGCTMIEFAAASVTVTRGAVAHAWRLARAKQAKKRRT